MDTQLAICPYCGKKFIYDENDKWRPCCSKICFYKRIGVFEGKKNALNHTAVHDSFCKACGKKVEVLPDGEFCSDNCRDNIFPKLIKRKSYYLHCCLCGNSFKPARSPKARFCKKCRHLFATGCRCFTSGKKLTKYGASDLGKIICESRETGKSYADLQREETLKMIKKQAVPADNKK